MSDHASFLIDGCGDIEIIASELLGVRLFSEDTIVTLALDPEMARAFALALLTVIRDGSICGKLPQLPPSTSSDAIAVVPVPSGVQVQFSLGGVPNALLSILTWEQADQLSRKLRALHDGMSAEAGRLN